MSFIFLRKISVYVLYSFIKVLGCTLWENVLFQDQSLREVTKGQKFKNLKIIAKWVVLESSWYVDSERSKCLVILAWVKPWRTAGVYVVTNLGIYSLKV